MYRWHKNTIDILEKFFYLRQSLQLSGQNTSPAHRLNFLFGTFAEKPGLYNDGLFRQSSFAQDFEVSLKLWKY